MNPSFVNAASELGLAGKCLIIPVVSAANVSQLAVDLLITSFELHRLAIFSPEYFIPMVGGREGSSEGITTPFELYGKVDSDLLVIQQRSPVLKSRKQDFVTALLEFIQSSRFGSVLFLSGVDLSNRADSQMFTSTYQVQPRNSPSLTSTALNALTTLPIPAYTSPVLQSPHTAASVDDDPAISFIPGGGLTRRILSSLPTGWSTPTASLLKFVLEGDNRTDARLFAVVIAQVVGQDLTHWRQPTSWKQGLFGTPHDQSLYG